MTAIFEELVWLLILLGPLLFIQRKLHREIQGIILLITHRAEITMLIFSLIFLPGVMIHELSHYITARLLGVKTGELSIIPRTLTNGKIQLGYVVTSKSDILRDSLIGIAPFLSGSILVALLGLYRLNISLLVNENSVLSIISLIDNIRLIYNTPDFFLWFYLTFTISSTMMPSASDRRAWLPMALLLLVFIGFIILIGIGPWLLETLLKPTSFALESLVFVLGISVLFHLILLLPVWILRRLLERITGYQVN